MKVLGIIPARFGSSRFEGKPLIDLKGKSMIQRVYEGALKSKNIHELVVATDDERIVDEVKRFGGKVMMTSKNHPTGTDRCGEIAKQFSDFDIVINIQGDEPLVNFKQLDELISAFENLHTQIATLGIKNISKEDLGNPNRIKIVVNQANEALYFSRSQVPNTTNNPSSIDIYPFLRHIGLYAFRRKTLMEIIDLKPTKLEQAESLEQLRWLFYGYKIQVVETEIETPNIDSPEDVKYVLNLIS